MAHRTHDTHIWKLSKLEIWRWHGVECAIGRIGDRSVVALQRILFIYENVAPQSRCEWAPNALEKLEIAIGTFIAIKICEPVSGCFGLLSSVFIKRQTESDMLNWIVRSVSVCVCDCFRSLIQYVTDIAAATAVCTFFILLSGRAHTNEYAWKCSICLFSLFCSCYMHLNGAQNGDDVCMFELRP